MTDLDIQSILLSRYPFDKILELTLLRGGVTNDNYVFSDGSEKYVARVCLFEPENQIKSLIPPATIFLLGYCLAASSSKDNYDEKLYMYGIRTNGARRILLIILISLFLAYLSSLYITFMADGL